VRIKRASLLVLSISFVAFLMGGVGTILLSKDRSRSLYKNLELFTKVFDIVKRNYVENPDNEVLIEGAVRGMLDSLDPHTVYLAKEEFQEMQADTRGRFGGLGIEIAKRNKMLTVISPIEDTPAFKAGIKSGDIIVKIEDKLTDKLSIFDAVKLMRGKPGTKVTIYVKRENVEDLITISIVRAIIKVKSVTAKEVDGFPVIKIKQFLEKSSKEMRKEIRKARKKAPIRGLVLDLRNNPGGLLQQAVEISDTFLKEGLIVYTKGRDDEKVDRKFAAAKNTETGYPVVVLINGGSASASEIVAGALQDQGRAYIMGTQSFGKGSVQNVIPLDNGAGLKLTVALYYTPKGRTIQGVGIAPDRVIEIPDKDIAFLREKDLPGHIVGAQEKKDKKKADEKKAKDKKASKIKLTELEKEDYQLAKAIAYLKTKAQPAQVKK
jgi:carboxyl-terminal processing protease